MVNFRGRPRGTAGSAVVVLGTIGLLASPALLAAWFMGGFDHPDPSRPVVLAQLLFLVGWICSIVALVWLSAAGTGRARYLLWLQIGGAALAATQELQDLLVGPDGRIESWYQIADAAWPASVLFMIVTGTAVARGGVFGGWRRFSVLACGVTLPLAVALEVVLGRPALGAAFAVWTTCAWAFLAWAVLGQSMRLRDGVEAFESN